MAELIYEIWRDEVQNADGTGAVSEKNDRLSSAPPV